MEEFFVSGTRRVVIVGNESVGTSGNGWNGSSVGAGGASPAIDKTGRSSVTVVGNADAATTISVEGSVNGVTWYATGASQVLSGAGDFHIALTTGLPFVRVKSSDAATITATVVAI